jgi:hypothetical protein
MKITKQFTAFKQEPEDAMNLLEVNINSFIKELNLELFSTNHSLTRYLIDKKTGYIWVASALVIYTVKDKMAAENNFWLGA